MNKTERNYKIAKIFSDLLQESIKTLGIKVYGEENSSYIFDEIQDNGFSFIRNPESFLDDFVEKYNEFLPYHDGSEETYPLYNVGMKMVQYYDNCT